MIAQPHDPRAERTAGQIRTSLRDDRSPRNIRGALPTPDQEAFDRQYREALQRAADELDLAPLHECVESWWRYAMLIADSDAYDHTIARVEEVQRRAERGERTGGIPWDADIEARLRRRTSPDH